jgi:hypothetical protein
MVYTYGTRQDMAEKHLLLFLIGPRGLVVIDPGKILGGNIADRKCFFLALSDGSTEFRFEFIGLGSCSYKGGTTADTVLIIGVYLPFVFASLFIDF